MSTRTSALIAFLAILASVTLIAASHAPAAPVVGWEYQIVRGGIDIAAAPKVQEEQIAGTQGTLNNLGNEGWELAAIQGSFAVMKRPR